MINQCVMTNEHAFGTACRTTGVDDIGQLLAFYLHSLILVTFFAVSFITAADHRRHIYPPRPAYPSPHFAAPLPTCRRRLALLLACLALVWLALAWLALACRAR